MSWNCDSSFVSTSFIGTCVVRLSPYLIRIAFVVFVLCNKILLHFAQGSPVALRKIYKNSLAVDETLLSEVAEVGKLFRIVSECSRKEEEEAMALK